VVSTTEVAALLDLDRAKIIRLFDIQERRWARRIDAPDPADEQCCSDLAVNAGRNALAIASLGPEDIDTLIVASTTPDVVIPSLDYLVASKLGLRNVTGITIQAPCTGLFRGVLTAESLMQAGRCQRALVICAETCSPFFRLEKDLSMEQRLSQALFADGAGAIVLEALGQDEAVVGIDGLTVQTTGDPQPPGLQFTGMLSATPPTAERFGARDYLGYHDFCRVLTGGSNLTKRAAEAVFARTGTSYADYRWVLTHQATGNLRTLGRRIGIPPEKMPTNIERVGNTVAASILILLDELCREGLVSPGDRLLLITAESSSWSYAGMAVTWG
jgi:3-oxoacyl-[acyl-carrier-protein] synthase-3